MRKGKIGFYFFICIFFLSSVNALQCGNAVTENIVLTEDLLNCQNTGLHIERNNITLDCNGHSIIGGLNNTDYGIILEAYSDVTIKNCNVQEFSIGIIAGGNGISNNSVLDNTIENNKNAGIWLPYSHHNKVFGNTIINNNEIGLGLSDTQFNEVKNNTISNHIAYGIHLENSQYNLIWINNFSNNGFANADEWPNSNYNNWNYTNLGNIWSDYDSNPGYPFNYIISGDGNGIVETGEECDDGNNVNGDGCSAVCLNEPPQISEGCGSTIINNTILTEDILNCPGSGLIIGANNLTLDCAGHLLNSTHLIFPEFGIKIIGKNNILIKNCVLQGFYSGIYLENTGSSQINDNVVKNNGHGIHLYNLSQNNVILNNVAYDNSVGIGFYDHITHNQVLNNSLINNSLWGARSYAYNSFNIWEGNNFSNNLDIGLLLGSNAYSNFTENYFSNNGNYGVYITYDGNNTFWKNIFDNNGVNAFEEISTNNNNWNFSNIGNYWSDFEANSGYPFTYIIPGDGAGIDYHPFGAIEHCTDSDGGFKPQIQGTTCIGDDCNIDYCEDNTLHEYSCSNNNRIEQLFQCRGTCSLGACIPSIPICTNNNCSILALN